MPRRRKQQEKKERDGGAGGSVRGMWTGTISFGLVSVPVSLFPSLRRRPVHLRWLSPEGAPLRRQYICPEDGQVLDRDELVRGYELDDGQFVLVEDEELDAIAPEKVRDIGLEEFVALDAIADFYFDRPYFLAPAGGSPKAYHLLAHVMEERGKVGIGSFVMRGKEHLVAIVASDGILMAETMRFEDELRDPEQIDLPERRKPSSDVMAEMKRAISSLESEDIDLDLLKDRHAERFENLVEKKRKSEKPIVREEEEREPEPEPFLDLIQVFQERMKEAEAAEEGAEKIEDLTKEELYERAQARGIEGRSKMSKKELVKALT